MNLAACVGDMLGALYDPRSWTTPDDLLGLLDDIDDAGSRHGAAAPVVATGGTIAGEGDRSEAGAPIRPLGSGVA